MKYFHVKIAVEAPSHTKVNIAVLGFVAYTFTYWKVKWWLMSVLDNAACV